ncbi:MAG: sulfotransferase [Planctomycetota bacterium]
MSEITADTTAAQLCAHGRQLLGKGRRQEALVAIQQAVCVEPTNVDALTALAEVLTDQGSLLEAEACLLAALQQDPSSWRLRLDLGQLALSLGKLNLAQHNLQSALESSPNNPQALGELGRLAAIRGDAETAHGFYRRALSCEPGVESEVTLYHLLATLGHEEDAAIGLTALLDRQGAASPTAARALAHLVMQQRNQTNGSHLEALQQQRRQASQPEAVARLEYAATALADAQGHHSAAATSARSANAAMRKHQQELGRSYERKKHEEHISELRRAFDRDHFHRVAHWGDDSERPIFIVGMPRSGTTLVEQILASHPHLFGGGELELARLSFSTIPYRLASKSHSHSLVSALTERIVRDCSREYLERLAEYAPGAACVVDKQPENYLYLGWIATLFPRAKIIYCTRDPRDVTVSTWLTRLVNVDWSCDLDDIRHRIQQQEKLRDHWRRVLPNEVLEVSYEQLVHNCDEWTRRLIDFCGVPWDQRCLHAHQTQRWVSSASSAAVRAPVHPRSVGRWKKYSAILQ